MAIGAMLAMFILPVIAYVGLDSIVRLNCDTRELAHGTADSLLDWRLDEVVCKGGTWHDLSIGLRDKTPGLALTLPAGMTVVEVRRPAQKLAEIVLRDKQGVERVQSLRLKSSGSPAEQLDLSRPAR